MTIHIISQDYDWISISTFIKLDVAKPFPHIDFQRTTRKFLRVVFLNEFDPFF